MTSARRRVTRRTFGKAAIAVATGVAMAGRRAGAAQRAPLRFGGPVFEDYDGPEEWAMAVRALRYNAAYCPVDEDAPNDLVGAYEAAAKKADIVISEVGVWRNVISTDDAKRKAAFELSCKKLDLAERIGARCCVNFVGTRKPGSETGAHADNLTDETFDMTVEISRAIIDTVKPTRTFLTWETMPTIFPDSPDSCLRLIQAIDRKASAAHFDPVNLIFTHRRLFANDAIIRESFEKFGPLIKSCHAKDIELRDGFPVNLAECQPGKGVLDYATYLKEAAKLPEPPPIMLEHLETAEEYREAADYVISEAKGSNLTFA
jgi:sugar phosphate isomerase/epimerase